MLSCEMVRNPSTKVVYAPFTTSSRAEHGEDIPSTATRVRIPVEDA